MESNHLATTLLDNAYRVTAGNREHTTYLVEADGFEPPRFLQNRFTVCRLQPLGHASLIVNTLRLCHGPLRIKITARKVCIKALYMDEPTCLAA